MLFTDPRRPECCRIPFPLQLQRPLLPENKFKVIAGIPLSGKTKDEKSIEKQLGCGAFIFKESFPGFWTMVNFQYGVSNGNPDNDKALVPVKLVVGKQSPEAWELGLAVKDENTIYSLRGLPEEVEVVLRDVVGTDRYYCRIK